MIFYGALLLLQCLQTLGPWGLEVELERPANPSAIIPAASAWIKWLFLAFTSFFEAARRQSLLRGLVHGAFV